jgi:hypothetical protein
MKSWLAVAALGAALVVMPAWAQRGGHGGGFGGGHGGFSGGMHGGFSGGHAGFSGARSFGHGPVIVTRPGFGSRGGRWGGRRGWWPYYGYGWGWPYWGWGDYADNSDTYYPSQGYADNYDSRDAEIARDQQSEIERLNDEVSRLRDQREGRNAPVTAASSEKTQLIFNDKHSEEVQNYAIVGPTLWVLSPDKSRKIPLAQLDLPATEKVNGDRGVDFELPR